MQIYLAFIIQLIYVYWIWITNYWNNGQICQYDENWLILSYEWEKKTQDYLKAKIKKNVAVSFNKLKNLSLIVSIWMWMTWGELIQGTFIRI